jgi:hypothetical protein
VTHRNRIKGLSFRATDLQIRTPDSHSEGKEGKSGTTI